MRSYKNVVPNITQLLYKIEQQKSLVINLTYITEMNREIILPCKVNAPLTRTC